MVVEDSIVGLRAAKAANMKCVITYTVETKDEDFYGAGADAKLLDFSSGVVVSPRHNPSQTILRIHVIQGEASHPSSNLATMQASSIFKDGAVLPDLLHDIRDPKP